VVSSFFFWTGPAPAMYPIPVPFIYPFTWWKYFPEFDAWGFNHTPYP